MTRRRAAAGLAEDRHSLDLGEHRLKDFERPVWIFQLGARAVPATEDDLEHQPAAAGELFVGRERETARSSRLIREDGARLVTLDRSRRLRQDPPRDRGCRRARRRAARPARSGSSWRRSRPALVIDEIAKTLGAKDGLAEHIGEREMLLVLDNLEQVIEAAPALADLVEACPNLASSRRAGSASASEARSSTRCSRSPNRTPSSSSSARAGLAEADDVIRELCRALDDMPLAIELAAARANVLPAGRSSSVCRSVSTCSPAAAMPTRASGRSARRSSGRTTSSIASEQRAVRAPGGLRRRLLRSMRPSGSRTPASTRSSPWSRRASSVAPTTASGCYETIRGFALERLELERRGGRDPTTPRRALPRARGGSSSRTSSERRSGGSASGPIGSRWSSTTSAPRWISSKPMGTGSARSGWSARSCGSARSEGTSRRCGGAPSGRSPLRMGRRRPGRGS